MDNLVALVQVSAMITAGVILGACLVGSGRTRCKMRSAQRVVR
ncbi:hypothetical protein Q31b_10480 [Novipirellula aureliae]|uniref:Uncharacterized protein n=1 Tax=Novipirellula aureliae TaxID=2527966 RepID=A0A5C6EA36_9BACT|nr:hypothetical protein [Novipirellula aureliae]TWU45872.1 hypothetical protein Q31b_10480 [Novipirellula aureliae]